MIDQADIREITAAITTLLVEREPLAPLLTADEASALLNVPASWCLMEARAGRLPHVKLGKYTRFRRTDLEQWLVRRAS